MDNGEVYNNIMRLASVASADFHLQLLFRQEFEFYITGTKVIRQ